MFVPSFAMASVFCFLIYLRFLYEDDSNRKLFFSNYCLCAKFLIAKHLNTTNTVGDVLPCYQTNAQGTAYNVEK